MKNVLRLAVIATLLLGVGAIRADDERPSAGGSQAAKGSPSPASSEAKRVVPEGGGEQGAASMEPVEAIDEDPGSGAHQQWVESIWASP
jgi:hypothetical protein